MKTIIGFSNKGKVSAVKFLMQNKRNFRTDTINNWLAEMFDRVSDRIEGEHEPGYELASMYSKDNCPHIWQPLSDDFIWSEEENA